MQAFNVVQRFGSLRSLVAVAASLLFVKTLAAILVEYRWYFPPDFESSAFLTGRQASFDGLYQAAFYAHIVGGPLVVVLGSAMMLTGGRPRFGSFHRWAGKMQLLLVLALIVPSGLVMAGDAYAGPIAGWGFAALSFATGACAIVAIWHARSRRFAAHRRWATRCFLLLCSPLLLRVIAGVTIVTNVESEWTYRLNAWLSWLIPLTIYEIWLWRAAIETEKTPPLVLPASAPRSVP